MASRPNPYVGPRAFETGEALYGRDGEARQLLDLLIAERLVLLYSPSGAGKSSLVHAALLPSLQAEGFRIFPVTRVNLEPPPAADHPTIIANRYVLSVLLSLEEALPEAQRRPLEELARLSLADYLGQVAKAGEAQVFVFDQFEEILTTQPMDREGKAAFFSQLGAALRDRQRWALFAMREDYVASLSPYLRSVPTRLSNTFRLDLLGVAAALEALQKPPRAAGVNFTDSAAQKLVDDLRRVQVQRPDGTMEEQLGANVEPMQLQVVCYRLWEGLAPDDAQIDEADLAAVGDVNQSLASYYAGRVAAIAEQAHVSERSIREWFERKLITEQGIRSQVLMGPEQSEGLQNQAVDRLVNAHLVRAEKRGGATWYELSHDRLMAPVKGDNAVWFNAHLSFFQRQADAWRRQERPESLRLRGQELDEAEPWAQAHAPELLPYEREFLAACQKARAQETEARAQIEKIQQLEAGKKLAEQRARAARIMLVLASVTTAAAILAVLFGILAAASQKNALNQAAIAQAARAQAVDNLTIAQAAGTQAMDNLIRAEAASRQAVAQQSTAEVARAQAEAALTQVSAKSRLATANELNTQSLSLLSKQPDLAVLLSLEAARLTDTTQSRSTLLTVLVANSHLVTTWRGSWANLWGLAFSPEQKLTLASEGGLFRWGVNDTQLTALPPISLTDVSLAALSPDGNTLAVAQRAASAASEQVTVTLTMWNIAGKPRPGAPIRVQANVSSLVFSPDGKTLAAGQVVVRPGGQVEGLLSLWQSENGNLLGQTPTLSATVLSSLAFSPDGKRLGAGDLNGGVTVWETGALDAPVWEASAGQGKAVNQIAFSADGNTLASGGADGTIVLWPWAAGSRGAQTLAGHTGSVSSLAFSPDGKLLASGSDDKTVILWNVATRPAVGEPLAGHAGPVKELAFSPDGRLLASGSSNGQVLLWDTTSGAVIQQQLEAPPGALSAVAFSPDGKRLAVGGADGVVGLHNLATGQSTNRQTESNVGIGSLAFNPQEKLVALLEGSGGQGTKERVGGVDVWVGQGDVDWAALKQAGVTFAVARATDGIDRVDPYFAKNWAAMKAAGIVRGAYHNFVPGKDPLQQAAFFVQTVGAWEADDLPPIAVFDAFGNLSHDDLVSAIELFLNEVERLTHRRPMIYTAASVWNPKVSSPRPPAWTANYPLWVANYTLAPTPVLPQGWTDWVIWQYTDKGSVNGIAGNAVLNRFNGSLSDLQRFIQGKPAAGPGPTMLWSVDQGQAIGSPFLVANVSGAAFSPNGAVLAVGHANGAIQLWNAATGQPQGNLPTLHTDQVYGLAFSPGGKTLASASGDQTIGLWDVSDPAAAKPLSAPLVGHTDQVLSVAFSPDGKTLASASRDKTLRLWDVSDPAAAKPLGLPITGQPAYALSVAFSPDGKLLAAGREDGTLTLLWFQPDSGQTVQIALAAHDGPVNAVAFSPDGTQLASVSNDQRVKLWSLDFETWKTRACRQANRNLTQAEWKQFLGDLAYQKTCPALPEGN